MTVGFYDSWIFDGRIFDGWFFDARCILRIFLSIGADAFGGEIFVLVASFFIAGVLLSSLLYRVQINPFAAAPTRSIPPFHSLSLYSVLSNLFFFLFFTFLVISFHAALSISFRSFHSVLSVPIL